SRGGGWGCAAGRPAVRGRPGRGDGANRQRPRAGGAAEPGRDGSSVSVLLGGDGPPHARGLQAHDGLSAAALVVQACRGQSPLKLSSEYAASQPNPAAVSMRKVPWIAAASQTPALKIASVTRKSIVSVSASMADPHCAA